MCDCDPNWKREKEEKCSVVMEIEELELQQLPIVAEHLSRFDLSTIKDKDLKQLVIKSRKYLMDLFNSRGA